MKICKNTFVILLMTLIVYMTYSQNNQKALIIGISKYKNLPEDLQLHFADKDANDFRNYLVNKINPVDSNDIIIRINEEATYGNLTGDMYALRNNLKKGDTLYIFISCHGDVVKSEISRSFLLLSGAKNDVDKGSDVYRMDDLSQYVNDIAEDNIKVFLFIDACRAGNLMGGEAKQNLPTYIYAAFIRAVRVLSCSANEKSVEKKSLGNGIFTYYLIRGLMGAADKSLDNVVTGKELDFYLKVKLSLANAIQTPYLNYECLGDPIVLCDPKTRNQLVLEESGDNTNLTMTTQESEENSHKSTEFDNVDMTDTVMYHKFTLLDQSLMDGRLVEPKGECAWDLYDEIVNVNKEKAEKYKLQLIRISINDAQNVMNRYLDGGNNIPGPRYFNAASKELKRVINEIGSDHVLAKDLIPKQLFFEAYSMSDDFSKYLEAITLLEKSIELDPYASYSYNSLGDIYSFSGNYNKAEYSFNKAMEISPTWKYPRLLLARNYLYRGHIQKAFTLINEVLQNDSTSALALLEQGYWYYYSGIDSKLSKQYYLKAIENAKNNPYYSADIYMLLGWAYYYNSEYEKAIESYQKSIDADSTFARVYTHFGRILTVSYNNRNIDSAILMLNKAISMNQKDIEALIFLGDAYKEKAEDIEKAINNIEDKKGKANWNINITGDDSLKVLKNLKKKFYFAADTTFAFAVKNNPKHLFQYNYDVIADYYKFTKKDYDKALDLLTKAYEESSYSPVTAKNLGDYYNNTVNNYDLAEKCYKEGIIRDSLYMDNYLQLRSLYNSNWKFDKEKELIDEIISKTLSPKFACDIADEFYNKDSIEMAKYWCYTSIEMDSTYKNSYNLLAKIYLKSNIIDSVVKYFDRCSDKSVSGDLNRIINDSADVCLKNSDTASSVNLLYTGSKIKWKNKFEIYNTNYKLVKLLLSSRKESEAIEIMDKMLVHPLDEMTWNKFASLKVSLMLESGNEEEVIKFYENNAYPEFVTLDLSIETAMAFLDNGNEDKAMKLFGKTFNFELPLKYYIYWVYQKDHFVYQKSIDGVNSLYTKYYERSADKTKLLPPQDFINYSRLYIEFGDDGVNIYNLMRANIPINDLKIKLGASFKLITAFIEKENIRVSGVQTSELIFETGFTINKSLSYTSKYEEKKKDDSESREPRFKVFYMGLWFDPSEINIKFRDGMINFTNENFDDAIDLFTEYIEAKPNDPKGYYNRGLSYYCAKLFKQAYKDFSAVIKINGNNLNALINAGDCKYKMHNFDESAAEYSKALSLNPHCLFIFYNRGLAFACAKNYNKAIADWDEGIKLFSFFAELYHIRGLGKDYADDLEGAIRDYEIAIQLKPDFTEAINHLDIVRSKLSYK